MDNFSYVELDRIIIALEEKLCELKILRQMGQHVGAEDVNQGLMIKEYEMIKDKVSVMKRKRAKSGR